MKKNKISFLAVFLATTCLFLNSKNLAAQDNGKSTADQNQNAVETRKDQEYELTVDKIDPSRFSTVAVIQALNKITAKTSLLEVKIGSTIKFGQLDITVHKCWQASLDQKPESKILMEVYDNSVNANDAGNKNRTRIFYGWMFASSPSISALEHPIYDITAVGCKNR